MTISPHEGLTLTHHTLVEAVVLLLEAGDGQGALVSLVTLLGQRQPPLPPPADGRGGGAGGGAGERHLHHHHYHHYHHVIITFSPTLLTYSSSGLSLMLGGSRTWT